MYKQVLVKWNYKVGDEIGVTIKKTGTYDLRAFEEEEIQQEYPEQNLIPIRV